MAIFNWGIYAGIGLAFPVGRYVTEMNVGGLVSNIFCNRLYYNIVIHQRNLSYEKKKKADYNNL